MIRGLQRPAGAHLQIDAPLKTQALEAVLHSMTFGRAEQLRNFLRYICDMEIAGNPAGITEYSIGVEALGRTRDFMPSEDGAVRNRAHVLRQKLLEYYTQENPHASLRIELPKGSYVPRFLPAESLPVTRLAEPKRWREFLIGFVAAIVLCAGAFVMVSSRGVRPEVDPVLREAWGPLAEPGANPLVVLATPTQFVARPYPAGSRPRNVLDLPFSPEVEAYFQSRSPQFAGKQLHLRAATAYRAGEVLGAIAVLKSMESMDSSYQVLADPAIQPASLRGRNLFLFGDPNLTPKVASYLEPGAFTIEYDEETRDFGIRERTGPRGAARAFYGSVLQSGSLLDVPGLLTVMPSVDAPDGRKRTVVIACSDSAGCQSAAEFFCSPKSLRDLKQKFTQEGLEGFPRAYQVIVIGRTDRYSVLSFQYVTHRVLDPSAP